MKKSRIPEIILSLIVFVILGYVILFFVPTANEEQEVLTGITFIAVIIGVALIYGELRTRLEQRNEKMKEKKDIMHALGSVSTSNNALIVKGDQLPRGTHVSNTYSDVYFTFLCPVCKVWVSKDGYVQHYEHYYCKKCGARLMPYPL